MDTNLQRSSCPWQDRHRHKADAVICLPARVRVWKSWPWSGWLPYWGHSSLKCHLFLMPIKKASQVVFPTFPMSQHPGKLAAWICQQHLAAHSFRPTPGLFIKSFLLWATREKYFSLVLIIFVWPQKIQFRISFNTLWENSVWARGWTQTSHLTGSLCSPAAALAQTQVVQVVLVGPLEAWASCACHTQLPAVTASAGCWAASV